MAYRFQRQEDDGSWREVFTPRPDRVTLEESEEPEELVERFDPRTSPPTVVGSTVQPSIDFLGWGRHREVRELGVINWLADPGHPQNWFGGYGAVRAPAVPRGFVHFVLSGWGFADTAAGGNFLWGLVHERIAGMNNQNLTFFQRGVNTVAGAQFITLENQGRAIVVPPQYRLVFATEVNVDDFDTITMNYFFLEIPMREYVV